MNKVMEKVKRTKKMNATVTAPTSEPKVISKKINKPVSIIKLVEERFGHVPGTQLSVKPITEKCFRLNWYSAGESCIIQSRFIRVENTQDGMIILDETNKNAREKNA